MHNYDYERMILPRCYMAELTLRVGILISGSGISWALQSREQFQASGKRRRQKEIPLNEPLLTLKMEGTEEVVPKRSCMGPPAEHQQGYGELRG